VGRTGATKLQYLAIGKGTRQHALFAGKTGSGKSTLFHVIITNLALACSIRSRWSSTSSTSRRASSSSATRRTSCPHAQGRGHRVAIASSACSVLQRVDEELKRRGDMFRKLGVQDIAGYKRAGGKEPVPRCLLMIDEFQEFFVEDDTHRADRIACCSIASCDKVVPSASMCCSARRRSGGAFTLARRRRWARWSFVSRCSATKPTRI